MANRKVSRNRRKKNASKSLILFTVILVVGLLAFIGFRLANPYDPSTVIKENSLGEVSQYIEKYKDNVNFEYTGNGIKMTPKFFTPNRGIIFLGNEGVDPKSYIPLMERVADKGYMIYIINSEKQFSRVIDSEGQITSWAIGGHGTGGAIASSKSKISNKIRGLYLLGSYQDNNTDLTKSNLCVSAVAGTEDKSMNKGVFPKNKFKLPKDTYYTIIQGGDFPSYGNYTKPEGKITREAQQEMTLVQILDLVGRM